jgi:uncharacterized membrane-anchored protein YhcB (DUF1043 family)
MHWALIALAFMVGLWIGAVIGASMMGNHALRLVTRLLSGLERLDAIDREITRAWRER